MTGGAILSPIGEFRFFPLISLLLAYSPGVS